MLLQKAKCKIGRHNWFTEFDKDGAPVYRICQCCSKYQQPLVSDLLFTWATIEPGSITAKVLKQQVKIQNLITKTL